MAYVKIRDVDKQKVTSSSNHLKGIRQDMTKKPFEATQAVLKYVGLPLIIAGIVIAAILLTPMKEKAEMVPTRNPSEMEASVPPIDANAPATTKTATFALG